MSVVANNIPAIGRSIGRTPLVLLRTLTANLPGRVALKLETRHASGSVKERVAVALLDEAEAAGKLRVGQSIVAATSSNTGIALAQLAAARGYKLRLAIPEHWAQERMALLLYLGADVIATKGFGMQAARSKAKELAQKDPEVLLLDQFTSEANPRVHQETTAQEIWDDTGGEVACFVAGVGTGGTITGTARGLRALGAKLHAVAVEPAASPVLSGGAAGVHQIQGIGAGFVPPLLDLHALNEILQVSDDQAFRMAHRLATVEGILAGVSSGAALVAALQLASRPSMRGKLIVAPVCDSGERYVTTPRERGSSRSVSSKA